MIALIRKELRELALPALALVLCAAVIAGMELLYIRYDPHYRVSEQDLALSIWLVLSLVIAFLGGAAAMARESRQRMIALTSWPQSRAKLWLVKALVSFALTMTAIAAGFGVCLLCLLVGRGKSPSDPNDLEVVRALSLALPLCFAFGLMWSGLIGSVLGAGALGLLTVCATYGWVAVFFGLYLPKYWGPYVGEFGFGDLEGYWLVLVTISMALLAGAVPFVRFPILETKRRIGWALGLLAGMLALSSALYTGWMVMAHRPALDRVVGEAGLTDGGKTLYVKTNGSGTDPGGLWVVPAAGGTPRLVCRAGGANVSALGDSLLLEWNLLSKSFWVVNGATGRLRRLQGEPLGCSPDGRYWATMESPSGIVVRDARGRVVKAVNNNGEIIFAPDNRTAYYWQRDGRVMRLDLPTRQETEVLRMGAQRAYPMAASPDGRTLVFTMHNQKGYATQLTLLDLATRRQTVIPNVYLIFHPFVTDRYAWGRLREPGSAKYVAQAVVDMQARRVATTIPAAKLGGMTRGPWHQEGVPYVVFPTQPERTGPPDPKAALPPQKLWLAKPDGSGLRFLREETREVLGMTAQGRIILWERPNVEQDGQSGRRFVSWDPVGGEEQVVLELPEVR